METWTPARLEGGFAGIPESIWDAVIARLSAGEYLHRVCDACDLTGYPSADLVMQRVRVDENFRYRFVTARGLAAERAISECIPIADAPAPDSAALGRAKLRVDTRLKVAEALRAPLEASRDEVRPLDNTPEAIARAVAELLTIARERADMSRRATEMVAEGQKHLAGVLYRKEQE